MMEAQSDPELRHILNRAVINTPDGMPMTWIGRLQGFAKMDRSRRPRLYGGALQARSQVPLQYLSLRRQARRGATARRSSLEKMSRPASRWRLHSALWSALRERRGGSPDPHPKHQAAHCVGGSGGAQAGAICGPIFPPVSGPAHDRRRRRVRLPHRPHSRLRPVGQAGRPAMAAPPHVHRLRINFAATCCSHAAARTTAASSASATHAMCSSGMLPWKGSASVEAATRSAIGKSPSRYPNRSR